MAANPIRERFQSVTPLLYVKDAPRAIEFYCRAFEAQLLSTVLRDPKGRIVHAELRVGNNMVMLAEEIPEWGNQSPESLGGNAVGVAPLC